LKHDRAAYRISEQIERNLKLMRHLFGCRALRQNFHFLNYFPSPFVCIRRRKRLESQASEKRSAERKTSLRLLAQAQILLIIHMTSSTLTIYTAKQHQVNNAKIKRRKKRRREEEKAGKNKQQTFNGQNFAKLKKVWRRR
jgi:hypothetical protein